jgi:hypothetical protein
MPTQDTPEGAPGTSPAASRGTSPAASRGTSHDSSRLGEELEAVLGNVLQLVREADPRSVSGNQALAIVGSFAEIERAAASGVALFTPVVVETGSFAKEGHPSAQDWFGSLSGTSAAKAKGRLAAAERAAADPQLNEALHAGELSPDQLGVMATTATEVPEATGDLLDLVGQGASHQELSDTAARLRAAARSRETERLRRARVHATRHLRAHQADSGGIRGEFFCDEVKWAKVAPRLEARAKELWKAAGGSEGSAALEAYRLDAFLELLGGSGTPDGPDTRGVAAKGTHCQAIVVIDAAALRRGSTEGDELCEIDGIGPVSIEAATELLSEASLRYVIREGFDIKTVTKSTRDVAACLEAALLVRDRACARPGCGKRFGLERDHRDVDFGDDGPTELDNLVRLCPQCHDLKTYGDWRLEGKPGAWRWIAPAHPKSAGYIARARRLAAAKGRARAARQRNLPRRD